MGHVGRIGHLGQWQGWIALAGWITLEHCRRPPLVVQLCEAEALGGTKELLCRSLGGEELVRFRLGNSERQALAELLAAMVTELQTERGSLSVISPDGRLVPDLEETTLVSGVLRP